MKMIISLKISSFKKHFSSFTFLLKSNFSNRLKLSLEEEKEEMEGKNEINLLDFEGIMAQLLLSRYKNKSDKLLLCVFREIVFVCLYSTTIYHNHHNS